MSTLAEDVKAAIANVGSLFDHAGQPGYMVIAPTDQPYYIKAKFPFDTTVSAPGSLLQVGTVWYLSLSVIPEPFENTVVRFNSILLTCNMAFDLRRFAGIGRDEDLKASSNFTPVVSGARGAQLDAMGQQLTDSQIGSLLLESNFLYVPESYGAQLDDRVAVTDVDNYRVIAVKEHKFPGISILTIGDDTR